MDLEPHSELGAILHQPIQLPKCFCLWAESGELRENKCGEHAKVDTDSNLSPGLNSGPGAVRR